MKISSYDRIQAIKHSKIYLRDYLNYFKERDQEGKIDCFIGQPGNYQTKLCAAGKRLCKKYNIRYPVVPYSLTDKKHKDLDDSCELQGEELQRHEESFVHCPVSFLDNPAQWKEYNAYGWEDDPEQKLITHVDGKLVLQIDLSYPSDKIMAALKEYVDHWSQKSMGRDTGSRKVDRWKIYFMKEYEGKTTYKIAQELFGVKSKSYSPEDDKHCKLVNSNYDKACKIVKAIESSIQKTSPKDK